MKSYIFENMILLINTSIVKVFNKLLNNELTDSISQLFLYLIIIFFQKRFFVTLMHFVRCESLHDLTIVF